MDHVGRIPRLIGELRVPFRDAEDPTSKADGVARRWNTPDLCDRRRRGGLLYNGLHAFSSPSIDERHPSYPLWNLPIGAVSLCGPVH